MAKPDHKICTNLGCHFHRLYMQKDGQIWNITNPECPHDGILLKLMAEIVQDGAHCLWFNELPTALNKKVGPYLVPIPKDFFGVEQQLSLKTTLSPVIEDSKDVVIHK